MYVSGQMYTSYSIYFRCINNGLCTRDSKYFLQLTFLQLHLCPVPEILIIVGISVQKLPKRVTYRMRET